MLPDGDIVYWADSSEWSHAAKNRDNSTWIAAKRMSWRDASDWMGPALRYAAPEATSSLLGDGNLPK